ncbi:YwmB family TATA-box binding protein [Halalkalibacterium ligniniphilum]|uniref:YwmB family TATA-box binding protein n=1 Tax=Halalkalibacterium ligniniphilum TaxID=1134413 RepID=UPI0003485132|nr:YwmB family TATA-box binding protein [Halalkalibacterium ligniniphilum]
MKARTGLGLMVLTLITWFAHFHAYGEETESSMHKLQHMVEQLNANNIDVEEWTFYTRKHVSHAKDFESYDQQVRAVLEPLSGWEVSEPSAEDPHWTAKAVRAHPHLALTEKLTILAYPTHNSRQIYMIYDVHGKWREANKQKVVTYVETQQQSFGLQENDMFVTVVGKTDTNNDTTLYQMAQQLLMEFDAKEVEALKEEAFVSLSAYNNQWTDFIVTNGKTMNLQLALRHNDGLGGRTTVTIGTPIITNEY